MPIIIWGRQNITRTTGKGEFTCPNCMQTRPYKLKSVQRYFTLYFIPLIPLEKIGGYIECEGCRTSFDFKVLEYDSRMQNRLPLGFNNSLKRVLALMVLVDGAANENEITVMHTMYNKITQASLSRDAIIQEIERAEENSKDVQQYLVSVLPNLSPANKDLILTSAYFVAEADSTINQDELALLRTIGKALDLSSSQTETIIQKLKRGH